MEKGKIEIPLLKARDVELRVGRTKKNGDVVLLAYKDARVDMNILDQVFGYDNWKRDHVVIDGQLFCTVSVWDESKGQWITKQDVGTESKTEAEKGRASDSFKRACVNLGIGRELYDAPDISIKLKADEDARYTKFRVKEMSYNKDKGEFDVFTVVDKSGCVRFSLKETQKPKTTEVKPIEKKTDKPKPAAQKVEELRPIGDPDDYEVINRAGEWVSIHDMTIEQLNLLLTREAYKDGYTRIRKELAKRGSK